MNKIKFDFVLNKFKKPRILFFNLHGIRYWRLLIIRNSMHPRVHPRLFDQVGHKTMYASCGNKHFFTKSCHCQSYQNYEQPPPSSQNSYFQRHFSVSKIDQILLKIFFYEVYLITRPTFIKRCIWKFWFFKILYCLKLCPIFIGSALFIILVSLTMTRFSGKMLLSTWCVHGFMSNLIKTSWMDSNAAML